MNHDIEARVERLERDLSIVLDHLGIDDRALAALSAHDEDRDPTTWEQCLARGMDPDTGEPLDEVGSP